jgi:hypothetical protein
MSRKDLTTKELIYFFITLIFIVPLMFANVWFLQQIWNNGLHTIFTNLPVLTYKITFVIYFIKSIFGLEIKTSVEVAIDNMINKKQSLIERGCISLFSNTLTYLVVWFIVIKILL